MDRAHHEQTQTEFNLYAFSYKSYVAKYIFCIINGDNFLWSVRTLHNSVFYQAVWAQTFLLVLFCVDFFLYYFCSANMPVCSGCFWKHGSHFTINAVVQGSCNHGKTIVLIGGS